MDHLERLLNYDQEKAYKKMLKGKNIFLTGAAGTGKTFTLSVFIKHCRFYRIQIGITSTTGVSALLLKGSTLHSWAGIGLGQEDKFLLLNRVERNFKASRRWVRTKVLIIDEISMMSSDLLIKLDFIGRKIRKNEKPFGGIQLIFSGDFFQLSPVKADYCFKDPIWNELISETVILRENIRQSDPKFQQILTEVRLGSATEESIKVLKSRIGAQIITPTGIIPTKLYSHRATVKQQNLVNLKNLISSENPLVSYDAKDELKSKTGKLVSTKYEESYLERINKLVQAPKRLDICIGAQVMLLFNLNVEAGLANGSRGVVIRFENRLPVVRFMNGLEEVIDKNSWEVNLSEDIVGIRNQVPLTLAWAVTVHKSQGMTLDCAQLDLGSTIFGYGQAYTALSRVRSLDCLTIVTLDPTKLVASPDVIEFYFNK